MPDSSPARRRRRDLVHPLRSVRVRITVAAVLVTAVAVGTAGGLLVRSVEDSQIRQVRGDIDNDLDQVAAGLEDGMPLEDIGSLEASSSLAFLQVTDGRSMIATFAAGPQGTFLSTEEPGAEGALPPPWPPMAGEVGGETRVSEEVRNERRASAEARSRTCATGGASGGPCGTDEAGSDLPGTSAVDKPTGPLGEVEERRGEVILGSYETISRKVDTDAGELTLTAAVPVDQLADTVDTLRRGLTIGLPALIAVVAALAWVLVGRALRPVEAIRTEVDAITGSTMHRRVPVPPTGDEIGRLARTMNAMLGRLDAAATRQRQFVSDASHELRSPVAALRTCLEVAGRHPDRADWPAVVGTALAEESRLEALLDDLLLLAAHDEGVGTAPEAGAVDVAAIVEAEAARPRRVPVEVRLPAEPGTGPPGEAGGAPVVRGDADRLARALANLVDNAARYATDAVRVTVGRHDDALRVTVDDDGPGIPAADRERVFERFSRLDDGRARPEGGTGLGLAVVRSIVEQHHGRVWAEDNPVGGARLVVELPVVVGQGATKTSPPVDSSMARGLTDRERAELRERLLGDRATAARRLAELERTFDELVAAADLEPPDDEHDPDGTTAYERAQVTSLAAATRTRRDELDRALAAIDGDGDDGLGYGVCEQCGGPIGIERLRALPGATRCVTCAAHGRGPGGT